MEKRNICLALGFFDSVHIGHRKIISSVKELSYKYNSDACVMTFKNNIYGVVKKDSKLLYLYDERIDIFNHLDVFPIAFEFTSEFGNLDKEKFLRLLTDSYNIKAFVCGKDFTFGKGKNGNSEYLKVFSSDKNIEVVVEDDVCINGNRISTTLIKDYLSAGRNLSLANAALGEDYFLTGKVEKGMGRGKTLGFPTANIKIPNEKFLLAQGVYATDTEVDGKIYRSITNVGKKPTFSESNITIETHIIDYYGNLYGKAIKTVFRKFMRDIICFSDTNELINQLREDKKARCCE